MRWQKVDSGQPITWSYRHAPNPVGTTQSEVLRQLRKAFDLWIDPTQSSLRFQYVMGIGDIHHSWANLDGVGGMLGATWMPRSGHKMNLSAPMGDIRYDRAETTLYSSKKNFVMVAAHEIGHAIGLPHLAATRGVALMNPFFNPAIKTILPYDRKARNARYPHVPRRSAS